MKKLLYVSFENSENRASGVNKKITGQMQAFNSEGYEVDMIARYQDGIAFYKACSDPEIIKAKGSWRISLCSWAAEHAAEYDITYIRFQFFCPFVMKMLKRFHKEGVKTIMEIPTYPYEPELKKQGTRGIHKRLIDAIFKKRCAIYIDSFATPLYDKPIMGRKCLEIRNGIDVAQITPRKKKKYGKINLLAVAMMAPWHGYDRMIEGLHNYYEKGGNEDIIFHLVGEGASSSGYTTLIEKYGMQERIIQHGRMYGAELDSLYDIADIGVGSLGIHRTDLQRTNTLKIMEYMAKGIPVICEHSERGISEDNKFRLTVSDDDEPIDINRVVEFYRSVYEKQDIEQIISQIREACEKNCNIKAGLKDVLLFMKQTG